MLENSKEKKFSYVSKMTAAVYIVFSLSLVAMAVNMASFDKEAEKVLKIAQEGNFQFLKEYSDSGVGQGLSSLEIRLAKREMFSLSNEIMSLKNKDIISSELSNTLFKDAYDNELVDVFINGQVNPKYREKVEKIKYLSTIPMNYGEKVEYESYYKKLSEINVVVQKSSESNDFKKGFDKDVRELSIFFEKTANKKFNGLDVVNVMRQHSFDEEYQEMLMENKYQELWSKYFEETFGKDIHPILYLNRAS